MRDPKVSHFFRKTMEKWDTLGTFTQKVLFRDYKKEKNGTVWGVALWGHMLIVTFCDFLSNFPNKKNTAKNTLVLLIKPKILPNCYRF